MKRKNKKRLIHISNNWIALIAVLVATASLIVDYTVYKEAKQRISGNAVSTAEVNLCLNNRPSLSNCQNTATLGILYACDIDIDINQTLAVSDNSSFFNVTNYGIINFTPSSAGVGFSDVGFHAIEINASDNSGCGNSNNTLLLNLTILDIIPPKINITKLAPTSISNITLTGTYSEDDILANITIEFNSSNKVNASFNTATKTWSAAVNLTEGWNKFYVLAYDASGNFANVTSSSQGASVLLDTTKPTINLATPQNESSVANKSLIAFKISDLSLATAFYTINSGATASFNSVYELKAGTSDWTNGVNYIVVNATDFTNNVERKNFTFTFSNNYAVVLNNSIITAVAVINDTNGTINNLQNSAALQSLVNTFAAAISVKDYNKTIQALNVVANLSNAVDSIQSLLQGILDANSSNQNNAAKTETINAKLEEISIIKNTTVSSVDVNLFNSNLTVTVDNTTKNNVTNQILAAVTGLSAAEEQSFRDASAALQNKTTITNKVQTLTQTFLNGRTENITLFEKNVSINQTQSGQFYVNEIIDKNITGNNDLNANTDITNRISQTMTVVVADPTVSWSFNDATGAVISYSVDKNVPSDKFSESQTVVTTVPTAGTGTTTSGGGGSSGGSGGGTSGGGGGIGAGLVPTPSIKADKDLIKISLKEDQIITESLSITNDGNVKLNLNLKIKDLEEFISLSDNFITLSPGETKIITLKITGKLSGAYSGKLLIENAEISKAIKIFVEVEPKQELFDAKIKIHSEYKKVKKGSYVEATIALINFDTEPINVNLYYAIRDFDGNVISFNEETLRISDELSIIRRLKVPENINQGDYIFYAKAAYNGNIAISSDVFNVVEKSLMPIKFELPLMGVLVILMLILIILTILNLKEHKEIKYIIKINEILGKMKYWGREKKEITEEDLEGELQILKADLEDGIINKYAYNKQKKKIEDKLNKVKK